MSDYYREYEGEKMKELIDDRRIDTDENSIETQFGCVFMRDGH